MLRGEGNIKVDFKEIRFDVSSIPFLLLPQKFKLCDCFTYILTQDAGSKLLQNHGTYIPVYTASYLQ